MTDILKNIQTYITQNPDIQTKFMIAGIVVTLLVIIRWLILKAVWNRTDDVRTRYIWQKSVTYFSVVLAILIIGPVWSSGLKHIDTFLGLLTAGVAIALKDPISNIAGWFFIIASRPFTVGDRIQIGDNHGDIIDIRVFQFTLLEIGNWVDADQSTGRIIHIPNGKVFSNTLANYSKGFQYIWNELPVLVTFESNWKKAKEILEKTTIKHAEHLTESTKKRVRIASGKFMIRYGIMTPAVYTSVKDSGILLTIRYLCEPRKRRDTEQEIWEDILTSFLEVKDIELAYPTIRHFNSNQESEV